MYLLLGATVKLDAPVNVMPLSPAVITGKFPLQAFMMGTPPIKIH